jgi:hypothetical protein
MCGNATNLRDVGGGPGKSSLFFLRLARSSESVYPEMRIIHQSKKHPSFGVSGALLTTLEKRRASIIHTPGRTYNRSRSSRLATSGLLNNVSKGSRQNRSVTLG